MKPIKFPFMKNCGYISKNNIVMIYNGILFLEIYPVINAIRFVSFEETFLLYCIQNNRIIAKDIDDEFNFFYNKIFDRIKNDS